MELLLCAVLIDKVDCDLPLTPSDRGVTSTGDDSQSTIEAASERMVVVWIYGRRQRTLAVSMFDSCTAFDETVQTESRSLEVRRLAESSLQIEELSSIPPVEYKDTTGEMGDTGRASKVVLPKRKTQAI
jgi:hypothetical protein